MLSPALEAFSICLMQLGELSIWKARQLMHLGAKISLHKRRTRHSGVCKLISFLGLPSDSVKHTLHKLVESKRRHAGGDGEDPRRLDRIELDWIKGCHCLEWLFQVHSIPRPTGTSITISTPWEGILSWCYMSWKLFEWMINIYGWVFGGQTKQNRTETKRNKTNSLLLLLGAGKRPSHWYGAYIWHTHTHKGFAWFNKPLWFTPYQPRRKLWQLVHRPPQVQSKCKSEPKPILTHGRRPASKF